MEIGDIQEKGRWHASCVVHTVMNGKAAFLKLSTTVVLLVSGLALQFAYAHDLVWPGEKLATMYPGAESFEQRNLYVSLGQKTHIAGLLGEAMPEEDLKPSVYLAVVRSGPDARARKVAAMMFIDAWGKHGRIEMGVVVDGSGALKAVHIFENEEPDAIRTPAFLEQFVGKTADQAFLVGKDIKTPPGLDAETAQAVASGARRGLVIINELFGRKS